MKKLLIVFMALIITFSLTACEELYYQEYSVSGKVEDESGNGIENVEVMFNGTDKITTNKDGEWNKSGLTGSVKISFNKDKYDFTQAVFEVNSAKNITVTGSFNGSTQGEGGEPVTTYNLSGKITDKDNDPIEDVIIRFDNGYSSVKTDTNGNWSKSVSETVVVTPEKNSWKFEPENRSIDSDDDYVDFVGVVNNYKVSGTVTHEETEEPIPEVEMIFSDGSKSVYTDSQGNWEKTGLTEEVTITPKLEDWQFNTANETVSSENTEVDFTGLPGNNYEYYSASGKIVDNGYNAIAGVLIKFRREDGTLLGTTVSDKEGNWNEDGLWGQVIVIPDPDSKDFITSFNPPNEKISGESVNIKFIAE